MNITLPDGSVKEFSNGATGHDVAMSIAEGLARNALGVEVDGKLQDVHAPITKDATVRIITFKDEEGKEMFWHSSAHLLAQAIKRLYPKAKPTIGPPIDNGFYYDFDDLHVTQDDLEKIEAEMKKIVKEAHQTKRVEYASKEEAKEIFKDNKYKIELVETSEGTVSAYEQGEFLDLCRGPHIPNTKMIKALKLTKISGAYWRGNSDNKQLTRIYGITFPDKKELKEYLAILEEAKKRDHRILGQQLQLFSFHELSPGSPFFHPNGTFMYNQLLSLMREEYRKRGYQEVITPLVYDKKLWETSGHWEFYRDDMFIVNMDHSEASIKPMNCPSHCLMYKMYAKSYRDLPVRMADFAPLHRNELKGALGGLTRVRKFSQDDAHIFCKEEQIHEEIKQVLDFIRFIYSEVFDVEYHVELSTRPEKSMGTDEQWEKAESSLKSALEDLGMKYVLNPGDGAFYGPKIDVHVEDSLKRTHQVGTVQLDFQLPQRFELEFDGEDGKRHRPVMIHRAVLGSLERFLALLVEHYAGKFPLWLSPTQVVILPIADRHLDYANEVAKKMEHAHLRVHVDDRSESTKKKVRDAQIAKWNYILVVGDKEVEDNTVNVRTREEEVLGEKKTDDFIAELVETIQSRK